MTLSPTPLSRILRPVLMFEAIILNAGTGLLCLVAPAAFIRQFTSEPFPDVTLEFIRWYGVLLWVLTYVVLRILPQRDDRTLAPVVEALLFGDFVHLVVIYLFYRAVPVWSFAFILMLLFTLSLATVRSLWLAGYHRR
ncbi:MAG: hypothetical protein KC425_12860 [Anaerolineales bacterium]|nr:hypothetical protein [Anaerolineales bacterium]